MEASVVRITENARGSLVLLEIVTPGRRSTLSLVRELLFAHSVQIAHVESIVREAALHERFYLLEEDGNPLRRRRVSVLRAAVKRALREGAVAAA